MFKIVFNKWTQRVIALAIAAVIGATIWSLITENGGADSVTGTVAIGKVSDQTEAVGNVTLRTGGGLKSRAESSTTIHAQTALGEDFATALPMTAAEAVADGWKDPILCRVGRGRYFQKGDLDEGEQYFLMYNSKDNLIGVYHFSEFEMPSPWGQMDTLEGGGGLTIIDFPHWGLFIYFQDSLRACKTTEATVGEGSHLPGFGGKGTQAKSTPTAVLAPTPTPMAVKVLETAVIKTSKLKALSFDVTGDPTAKKIEGTLDRNGTLTLVKEGVVTVTDNSRNTEVLDASAVPFSFDSLAATLSEIAAALQDPVDAKSAYINNLKRRGVSGTVLGSDINGLIPTAVTDASLTVLLWFDDRGRIIRLQVEGAVLSDDPTDTVRVFNIGDF